MSTVADLPEGWNRLAGDTVVGQDNGRVEAEAVWWGPWASYSGFLAAVGGIAEDIDYGNGIVVSRVVPLKFPSDSDLFDQCYATRASLIGRGMPAPHATEGITYSHCMARVYFETNPGMNFGADSPFMSVQWGAGLDFITRPGTAYELPSYSPARKLNQDVGVPVATLEFGITFYQVAAYNPTDYLPYVGRVNSIPFIVGDVEFPAGTIHYLNPSGATTTTVGNVSSWTISHRFKYREIEHNKIMRPDGSGFEAPVQVGTTTKILPEIDLNGLYSL